MRTQKVKAGRQHITRIHKMAAVKYERHVGARMRRASCDIVRSLRLIIQLWEATKIFSMMRLYLREVILAAVWSACGDSYFGIYCNIAVCTGEGEAAVLDKRESFNERLGDRTVEPRDLNGWM